MMTVQINVKTCPFDDDEKFKFGETASDTDGSIVKDKGHWLKTFFFFFG